MTQNEQRGFYNDPLEARIAEALDKAGVSYVRERAPEAQRLDFYLPGANVHIEVKAFHTERITRQMARVPFCIAVQGRPAVEWLASLIEASAFPSVPKPS